MRTFFEWLQAMLTAAAVAEEGEVEEARRIAAEADDGPRDEPKIHPIRRPRPPRGALAKTTGS